MGVRLLLELDLSWIASLRLKLSISIRARMSIDKAPSTST